MNNLILNFEFLKKLKLKNCFYYRKFSNFFWKKTKFIF